ncbi:MAG: helix-turn-helix domain-containing protein [Patescibacteria group bacterium]
MITKTKEKELALKLRKQGLSYNEILKKVDVSKSTLSVWLRGIGVAKRHQQRFTLKRKLAQLKAQEASRLIRIKKESAIIESARREIKSISKRELWIIGTVLYWAEGSKQKEHNVSQKVSFNNSDPKMILLFDKWVQQVCLRKKSELTYSIYIHQTADKKRAKKFWENLLETKIEKMYFKSHNPKTNRKNTQTDYFGLLRIDVKKSTDLNREIKGWIQGINEGLGI